MCNVQSQKRCALSTGSNNDVDQRSDRKCLGVQEPRTMLVRVASCAQSQPAHLSDEAQYILDTLFNRIHYGSKGKHGCRAGGRVSKATGSPAQPEGVPVAVEPCKVAAVSGLPVPRLYVDPRRFINLLNNDRRFVDCYADITAPLSRLCCHHDL